VGFSGSAMGSMLSSAFIPPGSLLGCEEGPPEFEGGEPSVDCLAPSLEADWIWGMVQCLSLLAAYGVILFNASNMLSEGSELLLLVPSLAGLVGSIVLPILGAVPDGAIMLFSGLGPGAQEQLQVGVGTLAGSTIMLLTIPWGLCILAGGVGMKDGEADYSVKKSRGGAVTRQSVLAEKMKGDGVGVTPSPTIAANARIMLATSLIYLIIQGPALAYSHAVATADNGLNGEIAEVESQWALGGLVVACIGFVIYLVLMVQQGGDDVSNDKIDAAMKEEIARGTTTILGLIAPLVAQSNNQHTKSGRATLIVDSTERKRLSTLLQPFFTKYDADGDGSIGKHELQFLLSDLGEPVSKAEAGHWMKKLDPDNSGSIHSSELLDAILTYVKEKTISDALGESSVPKKKPIKLYEDMMNFLQPGRATFLAATTGAAEAAEDEAEEEEEVEVPDDLANLSPDEQQAAIKSRAFTMMAIGTGLVLVFSDPMVEVMSNVGERLKIPPFYISFVLAPLASNASELLASVSYAKKKTQKTITVALAALEGAACMNNTFCLAIFMALIYFKNLAWKFTAETAAILLIQLIVGIIAMQKTMTTGTAYLILAMFPLSIVFIAGLESLGYD